MSSHFYVYNFGGSD